MLKKTVSVLLAALLVFGLVPMGAMQAFAAEADTQAVADPIALTVGTALTVESDGSEVTYSFTPTESREYKFYSKGSVDTVAELRDNAQAYVAENDDGGSESNFLITAMLDAGKTYYLKVWLYSGTGSFDLHVDAVPFAESVSIDKECDSYTGYIGTEVQLNATFSPDGASAETVSWESDTPAIASVDNSGKVSLISCGSALITVTSQNGLTDQITINVIEPGTISVGETKTVNVENPGEKTRFSFTAPESRRYVFYTTGNDEYDRYTEGYIIRGDTILNSNRQNNFRVMSMLQQGQEYILEAGIENWSEYSVGSFDVTIEAVPYATAVTINQGSAVSGYVGYNMYLSTTLTPEDAVDPLSWSSNNGDVATVNPGGMVTFVSPGTAKITASTTRNVKASIQVTVKDFETLTTAAPVTSEITYGGWTMMKYTPSESGDYIFSSSGAESQTYAEFGELDGYETNQLGFTYGYPDNDFMLRGKLTAGTTYYIRTGFDEDDDTGSYQVSVTKAPAATGMTITQGAAFTGYTNNTVELTVTFTPDGASEESVSWESSVPSIVSVDNNGIAELLTEGSAVITATSENGFTATCTITVKAFDDISAGETKDVDIISGGSKAYFRFIPDETATYSFYSSGEGDTYGELLDAEMNDIDSDDESAGNGHFLIRRELTAGSTYYFVARYYYSYHTGSFTVTLQKNVPATELAISASEFTGYVGDWTPLTVEFLPAGAIEEDIEWSSSNPRVANVDDNGYVGLISLGTTIITATSENGLTATCTVTVTEYEYETLAPGETKTAVITEDNGNMEFKITPDADAIYVFYSTGEFDTKAALYEGDSSEELASDDDGGENSNFRLQYTLEAGKTYYLKARFWGGSTGSFDVTCDTIPTATSISFEQSEVTGYVGTHDSLELIVEPEGAYTGEITYSCSNEDVVSLTEYSDSVRLDYLSEGTATITATTDTGLTAQCEVAVIDYEALTVGEPKSGSITNGGSYAIYSFVPEETGWYVFTSTADDYFCGYLYDSNGNHIGNQGSSDGSFRVKGELEAGKTYFIRTEFRDDDVTGDFTVLVEQGYAVTELTIIDEPETTTYFEGYDYYDIAYSGLSVELQWSDGVTTNWSYNGSNSGLRGEYITFSLNEDDVVTVACDGQTDTFALTVLENPVARIEITGEFPTLIEETGGFWAQRYNDETGEYERIYYYDLYDLYDTEVTIYYKNGAVKTACIGDTVDGYKVDVISDQYNDPFTLGDDNVVWVTYLGIETEATVTVAESPVASIEILGDPHPTYIEEADGYWSTRYNPATDAYDIKYFYYTLDGLDDVEVLIHFNDGTSATANVHDKVGDYYVEATSNQDAEPWTIGGENLITVSYLGKTAQLSATIVPNPVASITLPEGTTIELYENVDGYFNENGEGEYFNYYVPELDDIPVTVNYTDGTSVTSNINGKIDGKRINYSSDQYYHPWTKGGENFVTVSFMGRTAKLPVVITDSPVTSIEVVSNPTYVYTYGDDYYGGVNEFYPSDLTGLSFRVHFNDGTAKTYTSEDFDTYNRTVDGHVYDITPVNEQQTVGDNEFTLSYMGKTATFKVKVKQNTVSSVKMTRLPNIAAYSQYYSPDWVGAQITVTNTDNTTKTVTLSRDNLTYRNYMWGNGWTAQVEIDGVIATITETYDWDEDTDELIRTYFVLSYAGKTCEITGMTYREDKNVVSVEVEDYSVTGENMLVTALFEDGTSESVRFSDTYSFGTGFSPDVKMYAAFTEKGMLPYRMITATDIDNDVYVFGQYVDVDGGQGETFLRGDVDGDGEVTIADATLLQRYFAEYAVADRARIVKCGDANCDGKLNIRDVTAIQRYLADFSTGDSQIGKPV